MNKLDIYLSDKDIATFQRSHPLLFEGAYDGQADLGTSVVVNNLGVHIARPNSPPVDDSVIVIPRSYEACEEGFYKSGRFGVEAARDQVIANTMARTVVGIDTPGFGLYDSVSITSRQMFDSAIKGGMRSVAQQQLEALAEVSDEHDIPLSKIRLMGYSMGAASVAAMLPNIDTVLANSSITDLTLVEPANDQNRQGLFGLSSYFALFGNNGLLAEIARETDEEKLLRYLSLSRLDNLKVSFDRSAESDTMAFDPIRRSIFLKAQKRSLIGNGTLGAGLRKGFAPEVVDWYRQQDSANKPPFTIIRMDGSEIGREVANLKTAQLVGEYAPARFITVRNTEQPHHHTFWQSLGGVAALFYTLENDPDFEFSGSVR